MSARTSRTTPTSDDYVSTTIAEQELGRHRQTIVALLARRGKPVLFVAGRNLIRRCDLDGLKRELGLLPTA